MHALVPIRTSSLATFINTTTTAPPPQPPQPQPPPPQPPPPQPPPPLLQLPPLHVQPRLNQARAGAGPASRPGGAECTQPRTHLRRCPAARRIAPVPLTHPHCFAVAGSHQQLAAVYGRWGFSPNIVFIIGIIITAIFTRCSSPCQRHSYDGARAALRRSGCVPRRRRRRCCCCCCYRMLRLASDCLSPCRCVRHRAPEAESHGAGGGGCDVLETSIYA